MVFIVDHNLFLYTNYWNRIIIDKIRAKIRRHFVHRYSEQSGLGGAKIGAAHPLKVVQNFVHFFLKCFFIKRHNLSIRPRKTIHTAGRTYKYVRENIFKWKNLWPQAVLRNSAEKRRITSRNSMYIKRKFQSISARLHWIAVFSEKSENNSGKLKRN